MTQVWQTARRVPQGGEGGACLMFMTFSKYFEWEDRIQCQKLNLNKFSPFRFLKFVIFQIYVIEKGLEYHIQYVQHTVVYNRYCCYDGRKEQETDTVAMMVEKDRKQILLLRWQIRIEIQNRYCCNDGREGWKTDTVATMVEKDRNTKQILLQ